MEMSSGGMFVPFRVDGDGKGAVYDHFVLQRILGKSTVVLVPDDEAAAQAVIVIKSHLRGIAYRPLYWASEAGEVVVPTAVLRDLPASPGTLVVPGKARPRDEKLQADFDRHTLLYRAAIAAATSIGMPILAVCAGSWDLWHHFGGVTAPVHHHCFGGGMMRLNGDGAVICNVQIHSVAVESCGVIPGVLSRSTAALGRGVSVNSVHWLAPDEGASVEACKHVDVVARATELPGFNFLTRQSEPMRPQLGTVEAFEQRFGAPVLGVQWHPEAYADEKNAALKAAHCGILRAMALAGDAFALRRHVVTPASLRASRAALTQRTLSRLRV